MFRYRDSNGFERRLVNEAALISEIRVGHVKAGTPLAEGLDGPWGAAGRHPAYRRAVRRKGIRGLVDAVGQTRAGAVLLKHQRIAVATGLALVLLVGGGFTMSEMRERSLAEQRRAYAEAMLGLALGRAPAPELVATDPRTIDDPTLRTLSVRLGVAHTIRLNIDSAQAEFGIRGFLPPDGWLSDEYVTNARAFPEIGAHWAGYVAWDRAWSPRADRLLFRENARHAQAAGLTERQTLDLIDPAQPGLAAIGWDLELRREFALEASRLHTTLVESRGNVVIDDGAWWFADTHTQRAYGEHLGKLRGIAALLQEHAATRATALGVEPGVVVPASVASARPAGG